MSVIQVLLFVIIQFLLLAASKLLAQTEMGEEEDGNGPPTECSIHSQSSLIKSTLAQAVSRNLAFDLLDSQIAHQESNEHCQRSQEVWQTQVHKYRVLMRHPILRDFSLLDFGNSCSWPFRHGGDNDRSCCNCCIAILDRGNGGVGLCS